MSDFDEQFLRCHAMVWSADHRPEPKEQLLYEGPAQPHPRSHRRRRCARHRVIAHLKDMEQRRHLQEELVIE